MKIPPEVWKLNDYFFEFEKSIKDLNVVNDCSQRAVKLVQDLITITNSDDFRSGRNNKDHARAAKMSDIVYLYIFLNISSF